LLRLFRICGREIGCVLQMLRRLSFLWWRWDGRAISVCAHVVTKIRTPLFSLVGRLETAIRSSH
jgi:hypothetical protein